MADEVGMPQEQAEQNMLEAYWMNYMGAKEHAHQLIREVAYYVDRPYFVTRRASRKAASANG